MENKYIAVSYRLETEHDGERTFREEATQEHPFQFISGMGLALDDFEAKVQDLNEGEEFAFALAPEQAYGPYFQEAVQKLPANVFEIDGKIDEDYIYVGAVVPLQNAEGERFNGTITEMTPSEITVDLNHPLAGMILHFQGKVVTNRPATLQEMQEAAQALSGGCGCCGGCGGSCGEGGCGGNGDDNCDCGCKEGGECHCQ